MEFSLAETVTVMDIDHMGLVKALDDCLDMELSRRTYGMAVAKVLMCIHCTGDGIETGTVIEKKYTRSQRCLLVVFALKRKEVYLAEPFSEEMLAILRRGVMATYGEVKDMGIKDFDVDAFYRDVEAIINEEVFLKDPDRYRMLPYERQPDVYKGPSRTGSEQRFRLPEESGRMDFRLYADSGFDRQVKPGFSDHLTGISDYLATELSRKAYGPGAVTVAMVVWCERPAGLRRDPQWFYDAEWKRYAESRRILVWNIKLDYGDVMPSNEEGLVEILRRGILATYDEVKALGIRDFDLDSLYRDIDALFEKKGWLKNLEESRTLEADLWNLIQESIGSGNANVERQIAYLEDQLATRSEKEIVDFEATLWDLMKKSYHWNVMALLKAVDGTETHHIRFRCRLILYGQDVFYAAIEDPNNLSQIVENSSEAKRLLKVADSAFLRKFGRRTDKKLPTEVAAGHIEHYHREFSPVPRGTCWFDRKTFVKRYAPLLAKYKKPSAAKKRSSTEGALSETSPIPPELAMPEADFWNLIQQSVEAGQGSVEKQIAYLEESLASKSEKEIVGFELTFRDLIRRSYHHNIVALLKAIDGSVTDDPLLYFRCRLILYGREMFYSAVENPNKLMQRLDSDGAAEHLLSVADRAFIRKLGESTDKDLPSDVGATYIDYNTDSYPERGRPWTKQSFAKRYAALLKLYE